MPNRFASFPARTGSKLRLHRFPRTGPYRLCPVPARTGLSRLVLLRILSGRPLSAEKYSRWSFLLHLVRAFGAGKSEECLHKWSQFIVETDVLRTWLSRLSVEMQFPYQNESKALRKRRSRSRTLHIYNNLLHLWVACSESMHFYNRIGAYFSCIFMMVLRHA